MQGRGKQTGKEQRGGDTEIQSNEKKQNTRKTDTKSKLSENKEDGKENIKKKKGLNKEIHV